MADTAEHVQEFHKLVNMTAGQLDKWLQTEHSMESGQKKDGASESTGHEMGREIVAILHKKKSELDDADVAHMTKVVGYIKRHLAQRPDGDITETTWRYSLMNWGHDPTKD